MLRKLDRTRVAVRPCATRLHSTCTYMINAAARDPTATPPGMEGHDFSRAKMHRLQDGSCARVTPLLSPLFNKSSPPSPAQDQILPAKTDGIATPAGTPSSLPETLHAHATQEPHTLSTTAQNRIPVQVHSTHETSATKCICKPSAPLAALATGQPPASSLAPSRRIPSHRQPRRHGRKYPAHFHHQRLEITFQHRPARMQNDIHMRRQQVSLRSHSLPHASLDTIPLHRVTQHLPGCQPYPCYRRQHG